MNGASRRCSSGPTPECRRDGGRYTASLDITRRRISGFEVGEPVLVFEEGREEEWNDRIRMVL